MCKCAMCSGKKYESSKVLFSSEHYRNEVRKKCNCTWQNMTEKNKNRGKNSKIESNDKIKTRNSEA